MITAFELTRRDTFALGACALASTIARPALADEGPECHGISAFGDLKYPAGFKHFDYVDPNAPKGGTFSQIGATRAFNQNFLTFNSLNIFILKGRIGDVEVGRVAFPLSEHFRCRTSRRRRCC
jgi:microcin C transport system substrate-binding protein